MKTFTQYEKLDRQNGRESDGRYAVKHVGARYESKKSNQATWNDVCDAHGADGFMFSAPAGFSSWEYTRQAECVCHMFRLQPVAVEMVGVEVSK